VPCWAKSSRTSGSVPKKAGCQQILVIRTSSEITHQPGPETLAASRHYHQTGVRSRASDYSPVHPDRRCGRFPSLIEDVSAYQTRRQTSVLQDTYGQRSRDSLPQPPKSITRCVLPAIRRSLPAPGRRFDRWRQCEPSARALQANRGGRPVTRADRGRNGDFPRNSRGS
jgi:hypothetical protein